MKRFLSLLGLLAAVTAALLLPPTSAEAAPPGCFCAGYQNTPQDWATASTCQQARDNLRAEGYALIDCPESDGYGHCARGLVLTADCHWDPYAGVWQVDGYVEYRCWVCDPS
jgi:hypothetical protein